MAAAGMPPAQPQPSDVTLTISRAAFDQLKETVKMLNGVLETADAQVKAADKVSASPILTGAAPAAPVDPLAGFGNELNVASAAGLGG